MFLIGVLGSVKQSRGYLEKLIEKWNAECKLLWFASEEEILQNKEEIDLWIVNIDQLKEREFECILESSIKKKRVEKTIVVKSGTVYHSVFIEDIVFAENNGRKIILHLEDKILEFYGKMEELGNELGKDFFRCHRGYLVAMSKIKGYDSSNIYLKNGESVFLAKRKYGEFTEKYKQYIENQK